MKEDTMKHLYRRLLLIIVNLFKGMHFFELKRGLLNLAPDIEVGVGSRIVGPFWSGSVSKIHIGNNVFINREFNIEGNGEVNIGDNIDFGPNCRILTGGHIIGDSTHRAGEGVIYHITIGNGCWIGGNSLLLGNINIGSGSVIGAGSVVLKNVPPNVLIVGHPAEVKKEISEF